MTAEAWTRRRIVGEAAAYLLLAGLLTAILSAFLDLRSAVLVEVFVYNLLVALAIGTLIDLAHRLLDRGRVLERSPMLLRIAIHVAVVGVATFLGVEIAGMLGAVVVPEVAAAFPRGDVLRIAIPVSLVMVVIGRERERMRRRTAEAELGAQEHERQALRAELAALQSRTNPHFLFNALNTIAALIAEDPRQAERAVESLAELLRYALEGTRQRWVPLERELAAVRSYLELERLRYGDRLRVRVDIEPGLLARELPPMSLQPLVENAVVHAVAARSGPTHVELVARAHADGLELVIDDDGPGPQGSAHRGTGSAQADLRSRVALLYGSRATVETGARPGGGYRVRLVLPEPDPCA